MLIYHIDYIDESFIKLRGCILATRYACFLR